MKTWNRLARSQLARCSLFGSTDFSPTTVEITTGKKASETMMMIREVLPSPKRIRITGASAILGTTCVPTRIG